MWLNQKLAQNPQLVVKKKKSIIFTISLKLGMGTDPAENFQFIALNLQEIAKPKYMNSAIPHALHAVVVLGLLGFN